MTGGKAHGANREYQLTCRDVLCCRRPELKPWEGDGIDVPFELPDTTWRIDVALREPGGGLVAVECRRTIDPVKQENVAAFAYKVELLRRTLGVPVAGVFLTKTGHQIGAVRVGQFSGVVVAVLPEDAAPPAFDMTFHRYDAERERRVRDFVKHLPPASLTLSGTVSTVVIRKNEEQPQ